VSSMASEILHNMATVLRATGEFAQVTIGDGGSNTAVPRASVVYEGSEEFSGDDAAGQRWMRMRSRIVIHTRAEDWSTAVGRTTELCEAAAAALLADLYRENRCQALPIG